MYSLSFVNYRPYQPEDFAALYAIEAVCFQPPQRFTRSYMQQVVENPDGATWIAEDNGRLAAFCVVAWEHEEGTLVAYIETIEVAPEFRRQGIATELLRRAEGSAQEAGAELIWLHVDARNEAALGLYRAHGFELYGEQKHYYGRGRDAAVYCKRFAAS